MEGEGPEIEEEGAQQHDKGGGEELLEGEERRRKRRKRKCIGGEGEGDRPLTSWRVTLPPEAPSTSGQMLRTRSCTYENALESVPLHHCDSSSAEMLPATMGAL